MRSLHAIWTSSATPSPVSRSTAATLSSILRASGLKTGLYTSPHLMRFTERMVDAALPLHKRVSGSRLRSLVYRVSPVLTHYRTYPQLSDELQRQWALLDTHDSLTDYFKHFRTRGQIQRLLEGLSKLGWKIRRLILPAGFPNPSPRARTRAAEAFRGIPDGSLVLVDQLCLGVLPEVAAAEARRLRLVMIVHHPLALEDTRSHASSLRFAQSERDALRHVAAAIATSPATARTLGADYGVPADRLIEDLRFVGRRSGRA
jgi:hypothetical protein